MNSKEAKILLKQAAKGYFVDSVELRPACQRALEEIEELEQELDWWETCGDEI